MKTRKRSEEVLFRINSVSTQKWAPRTEDPFKTLVRAILSQNTTWRNEEVAYRQLEELIGVNPYTISSTDLENIIKAIKPAGMYNVRSKVIKKVALYILERFNGDLTQVISKPYTKARKTLMDLPGVGEKTADIVLLFSAGKPVIPVDRHITRIVKRLEIVPNNASYDEIRKKLEASTLSDNYFHTHTSLIQFGRETCKAHNPKCTTCILNDICLYKKTTEKAFNNKITPNQAQKVKIN